MIFPMSDSRNNNKIYFVNPEHRGIIPIKKFHISKSLLRFVRKRPFKITMNNAFPEVIRSCAIINRKDTWINKEIAIGGVFFAESMFSSVSNGSKIALLNLVARLWKTRFRLLDVQFLNDHLIQFGAYQITKTDFKKKLDKAIGINANIYSIGSTDEDFFDCLTEFLQARTDIS